MQINNVLNRNHHLFTASILITFLLAASCITSGQNNSGFVKIFDGKTLNGWKGDPTYWKAENGNLVGEVTPTTLLKTNTFITWQGGQIKDFELKAEFRITEAGNSGINYRSEMVDSIPYAMRGYQADIDGKNRYTGQNYEERMRTTLAYRGQKTIINPTNNAGGSLRDNVKNNAWTGLTVERSLGSSDSLMTLIKNNDWNECRIVAKGNRLQHFIPLPRTKMFSFQPFAVNPNFPNIVIYVRVHYSTVHAVVVKW